jgi:hypothetical protein
MVGPSPADRARWRWVIASQIGTSHIRLGTRKQDAARCFIADGRSPALCVLVCDGAGSAAFGGQGATLIGRVVTTGLKEHFRSRERLPTDQEIWAWVDHARDRLALAADRKATRRRNFASTMIMLVVTDKGLVVAHVGDGAAVARGRDGTWRVLSWPESGEYASTTYFLTDDPAPRLRIARFEPEFDACAVFSDGIEDLALDYRSTLPHQPFFRSMMIPLDTASALGKESSLSAALARFLGSDRVCARTDDDKSLILASSR